MSCFKRTGTCNLYCFGSFGYKKRCKNPIKYGNTVIIFMQASECVINYLSKNKFFVVLSTIYVLFFFSLPRKNAIFICLGEINF